MNTAALLAFALIAAPATALAQAPLAVSPAGFSQSVSFADLDLTDPAGAATYEGRLLRAARRVCDESARELRITGELPMRDTCVEATMDRARRQVATARAAASASARASVAVTRAELAD